MNCNYSNYVFGTAKCVYFLFQETIALNLATSNKFSNVNFCFFKECGRSQLPEVGEQSLPLSLLHKILRPSLIAPFWDVIEGRKAGGELEERNPLCRTKCPQVCILQSEGRGFEIVYDCSSSQWQVFHCCYLLIRMPDQVVFWATPPSPLHPYCPRF